MTSSKRITSSKGNQNKWCRDGKWYKVDGLGYEALAEVVISHLLRKSTIMSYVLYEYESVEIDNHKYNACVSMDFMQNDDDKVVSVERLFHAKFGQSAANEILKYSELYDQMKYVEEVVQSVTGLPDFGSYLREVITIDALFLNEDRHFHNIAVIQRRDGTYRRCPIFDNGAALLSDVTGDYPYSLSIEQCIKKGCAKPFAQDFDEQLDAPTRPLTAVLDPDVITVPLGTLKNHFSRPLWFPLRFLPAIVANSKVCAMVQYFLAPHKYRLPSMVSF